MIPYFLGLVRRVQQEGCARFGNFQNVNLAHERELVAGDKVSLVNQISGLDRIIRKTQVRRRHRTGFAGIVNEVALAVLAGVFGNNLNRVFVGADGAVSTQTEEYGADDVFGLGVNRIVERQRGLADVVGNADREAVERFGSSAVVINGLDHARRKFFGGQAVATAVDTRHRSDFIVGKSLSQRSDDVQIQRFADGAGFFGTVQNVDDLNRLRQSLQEGFGRERTVQTDFNQAVFAAVCIEVIDGFFNRFGTGTHDDDDLFGIGSTDIVNNIVFAAGDFGKLVHFFLNNAFNLVIERVAGFAALEEDVRVLRGTADDRRFRTQSVFGVEPVVYAFKHGAKVVVGQKFDFLDFVRSAETVKEVHKRNAGTQRGSLGNGREIVGFLNRVGAQHGKAGLTAGHDVGVVSEDGQRMVSQRTGGNVHDERRKFAGDFVHVRNHQEQTLRSGKGGGQGTGLD